MDNASRSPAGSDARQFVSSLILNLSGPEADQQDSSSNPLSDVSEESRNAFLTLHALFENELLPALHLLDRGLVTRLEPKAPREASTEARNRGTVSAYLVRSAQQYSSRSPAYEHPRYYEVHMKAWSCSCPAFIFSAFPVNALVPELRSSAQPEERCVVGGLTRGFDMPVCKHLLACVLAEHCSMFGRFLEKREVSLDEYAGWVAGWGD